MYDIEAIRADFPILAREVNGKPLVYLDNGASAQKPQVVIDAISRSYSHEYSNVHRGLHYLSNLATDQYESVRGTVARFLNAGNEDHIVFTSGTTEGINLVAYAWAMPNLQAGDEIILSVMEHHANIVPWHFLRERQGVVIKWVDVDASGALDPQAVIDAITPKTKLIAVTQVSNVLGTVVDVKAITAGAHAKGVPVLVDGSQAAVHMPVDVQDIGCDFYAMSAHKMYGPTGVGALWGRKELLESMPPWQGGGSMIDKVTFEQTTFAPPPQRFEAGTPAIAEALAFATACDFIEDIGLDTIEAHERSLVSQLREELARIQGVRVFGPEDSLAIVSFELPGVHPHDLGTILDEENVAIRAGHHCCQPLMEHLGVPGTARASFGVYSDEVDIAALMRGIDRTLKIFA